MIFVTVGTHEQPFDRLIRKIDELAAKGKIKEKIIAQIGYCSYIPENFEYFRFAPFEKMEKLFDSANLVITHAGVGSVFLALKKGKKVIVVSRMRKFGEHSDDHQIQVAKELERQGMIIGVYDIEDLEEAIEKSKNFAFKPLRKKSIIASKIDKFLKVLSKGIDKNEN
jgi:UDP-N-acetylglucosamine transferase subunit ALG13